MCIVNFHLQSKSDVKEYELPQIEGAWFNNTYICIFLYESQHPWSPCMIGLPSESSLYASWSIPNSFTPRRVIGEKSIVAWWLIYVRHFSASNNAIAAMMTLKQVSIAYKHPGLSPWPSPPKLKINYAMCK